MVPKPKSNWDINSGARGLGLTLSLNKSQLIDFLVCLDFAILAPRFVRKREKQRVSGEKGSGKAGMNEKMG
ncbi:hypothetical protein L596_017411 [Steinernema carpocapsae]|uniref:Uncharacterized protein n=1 Tax=Steinernema carpocapsae TaxID=34508 RepID=A0A4U5N1L0_STECR|nr:hypothetical protein L596_017411 [Steinernema carpocapsae]